MYNMTVFNAVQCERGVENHQVEGVPKGRVGVGCEHPRIISQLSHQNFSVHGILAQLEVKQMRWLK